MAFFRLKAVPITPARRESPIGLAVICEELTNYPCTQGVASFGRVSSCLIVFDKTDPTDKNGMISVMAKSFRGVLLECGFLESGY